MLGRETSRLTKGQIQNEIQKYGVTLTDYQLDGVDFMLSRANVLNADDMGLGKTYQAVATALLSNTSRNLIVAPASLLATWLNDGFRPFDLLNQVQTVKSKTILNKNKKFILVSYEWLTKNVDKAIGYDPELIIFDEAHYLKNASSQRTKSAIELRETFPTRKFVLLTGTPLSNRVEDMKTLMQLLQLANYDALKDLIKQETKDKEEQYEKLKESVKEEIDNTIIRRTKENIANLPNKFRRLVYMEMNDEDKNKYDELIAKTKKIGFGTKFRQLLSEIKIHYIKDIINMLVDKGLKPILFISYSKTAKEVKKFFPRAYLINGSIPKGKRQGVLDQFKREKAGNILILSFKTGATGLNITESNDVVFLDLDWNPVNHKQGEDRAYRKGQTGNVYVYYFILTYGQNSKKKTIEEEMFEKLKLKDTDFAYMFDETKNAFEIKAISKTSLVDEMIKRFRTEEPKKVETTQKARPTIDFDKFTNQFETETKDKSREGYEKRRKTEEERIYSILKEAIPYEDMKQFADSFNPDTKDFDASNILDIAKTTLEREVEKTKNIKELEKRIKEKSIDNRDASKILKENTPLVQGLTIKGTGIYLTVYEDSSLERSYPLPITDNVSIKAFGDVIGCLDYYDRPDLAISFFEWIRSFQIMYENEKNQMTLFGFSLNGYDNTRWDFIKNKISYKEAKNLFEMIKANQFDELAKEITDSLYRVSIDAEAKDIFENQSRRLRDIMIDDKKIILIAKAPEKEIKNAFQSALFGEENLIKLNFITGGNLRDRLLVLFDFTNRYKLFENEVKDLLFAIVSNYDNEQNQSWLSNVPTEKRDRKGQVFLFGDVLDYYGFEDAYFGDDSLGDDNKAKKSPVDIVLDEIIAQMERKDKLFWQEPNIWVNKSNPYKHLKLKNTPPTYKGYYYKGLINHALLLYSSDEYFMTFEQIKELGGSVKKGAKADKVMFSFLDNTYAVKEGMKALAKKASKQEIMNAFNLEAHHYSMFQKATYTLSYNQIEILINLLGKHKESDLAMMIGSDLALNKIKFRKIYYKVFSLDNVEGIDRKNIDIFIEKGIDFNPIDRAEAFINHLIKKKGLVIKYGGNQPYFSSKKYIQENTVKVENFIQMPHPERFISMEHYYVTLFHELVHWTKTQMEEKDLKERKTKGQEFEELIAEMGSSLLSLHFGIWYDVIKENNSAYVKSWLDVIKGDKQLLLQAISFSERALKYLGIDEIGTMEELAIDEQGYLRQIEEPSILSTVPFYDMELIPELSKSKQLTKQDRKGQFALFGEGLNDTAVNKSLQSLAYMKYDDFKRYVYSERATEIEKGTNNKYYIPKPKDMKHILPTIIYYNHMKRDNPFYIAAVEDGNPYQKIISKSIGSNHYHKTLDDAIKYIYKLLKNVISYDINNVNNEVSFELLEENQNRARYGDAFAIVQSRSRKYVWDCRFALNPDDSDNNIFPYGMHLRKINDDGNPVGIITTAYITLKSALHLLDQLKKQYPNKYKSIIEKYPELREKAIEEKEEEPKTKVERQKMLDEMLNENKPLTKVDKKGQFALFGNKKPKTKAEREKMLDEMLKKK